MNNKVGPSRRAETFQPNTIPVEPSPKSGAKHRVLVAVLVALLVGGIVWFATPRWYTSISVVRVLSGPIHPPIVLGTTEGNWRVAMLRSQELFKEAAESVQLSSLSSTSLELDELRKQLTISALSEEFISIQFREKDPRVAKALVEALARGFCNRTILAEQLLVQERISHLTQQLTAVKSDLVQRQEQLNLARKDSRREELQNHLAALNQARADLTESRREHAILRRQMELTEAELTTRRNNLERMAIPAISEEEAEDTLRDNPEYQKLSQKIAQAEKDITEIRKVAIEAKWDSMTAEPRSQLAQCNRLRRDMLTTVKARMTERVRKSNQDRMRSEIGELEARLDRLQHQEMIQKGNRIKQERAVVTLEAGRPDLAPGVGILSQQVSELEIQVQRLERQLAEQRSRFPVLPGAVVYSAALLPTEPDWQYPLTWAIVGAAVVFLLTLFGQSLVFSK